MTDRYDALCVREYEDSNGEKRTSWRRIGVAFPAREGDGYTILLDAMPATKRGQYQIILRPPREEDEHKQYGSGGTTQPAAKNDLDDDIPF